MKSISILDLLLIPELSHLSVMDVLNPETDALVNPFLYTMGFAIDKGLEYIVSYHRRLTKEACVGAVIVGEIRTDKEFLNSVWCTAEDRMISAGSYDQSMAKELAAMMGARVDYSTVFSLEDSELKEYYQDQDEIDRIEAELEAMGIVLESVRGNQRKRDGSLKRPKDYHEIEPALKVRRKKKNRSTLRHREQQQQSS